LPDDSVATGDVHTAYLAVSGMGSVNGSYDGVESFFVFYFRDDDMSSISASIDTSSMLASSNEVFTLEALLANAPPEGSSVTIFVEASVNGSSTQTESPLVLASGIGGISGSSELSSSPAVFELGTNYLFNYRLQSEQDGNPYVLVTIHVTTSSLNDAFNGLSAELSVQLDLVAVSLSLHPLGGMPSLLVFEGDADAEYLEVRLSQTPGDSFAVYINTTNTNPVFDLVPAAKRVYPYLDFPDSLPNAIQLSPAFLFFHPNGTTSRVIQIREG